MPSIQLQRLVKRLAIIAGGMIGALALSNAAEALTDKVFRYSAPRAGYFTIDSMAMVPDATTANYFNDWNVVGGIYGTNELNCFNTGVNLPQGATIVKMVVVYSSGATGNPSFNVRRKTLSNGLRESIAAGGGADNSAKRKTATFTAVPAFAVVDNRTYSYGFGACLAGGDVFYAARIDYTYETAGD